MIGLSISHWLLCPLAIWNLLFGMAILLNFVKSVKLYFWFSDIFNLFLFPTGTLLHSVTVEQPTLKGTVAGLSHTLKWLGHISVFLSDKCVQEGLKGNNKELAKMLYRCVQKVYNCVYYMPNKL